MSIDVNVFSHRCASQVMSHPKIYVFVPGLIPDPDLLFEILNLCIRIFVTCQIQVLVAWVSHNTETKIFLVENQ